MQPRTRQVQAFVTYGCNQNCGKYCPFAGGSKDVTELSIAELKQVFYSLYKVGIRYFAIIGGEPLIKEGIIDLLLFFADELPEAEVLLVSNAIELLHNPALRAGVVAAGPPKIAISFDGLDANPKSRLGLKALQETRAEYPGTPFWFAANCMINKANVGQIPEIYARLIQEGIHLNLCLEQTECFGIDSPTALTVEDLPVVTQLSKWLVETKRQSDMLIPSRAFLASLPDFVMGKGLHECRRVFPQTLHISPDGGMPTCEWHKGGGLERIFNARMLIRFPYAIYLWELAWKVLSLFEECRCSWCFVDRVMNKESNASFD